MRVLLCSLVGISLAACGDPAPREDPPTFTDDDPRFEVSGHSWYLIGNELTPEGALALHVDGPADFVDAWIGGAPGVRLEPQGGGFQLDADLTDLAPGDYDVLFAADGSTKAFASFTIHRSHPLYFQVSTDWDFSDPSDVPLDFQDMMHADHPGVLVTQFVGPYVFTDPAVPDEREAELVDWIKHTRDDYGDEIALHIHPYCNFVEYAGVTCNTDDSTVRDVDLTGYTVRVEAYGDTDFRTLLETADDLFQERDLGKPVTFRAGGWTASIETMRALAATGYTADTSALNWARIEEWRHSPVQPATLYEWNMEHWAPIDDTSQPYYPNQDDILSEDDPALSILEVPDNGVMVDYVSTEEMMNMFDENWDGTPLPQPTSFMMGWHPSDRFSAEEKTRVYGILDYADQFLASNGDGPVVYALLRDMPKVWKTP